MTFSKDDSSTSRSLGNGSTESNTVTAFAHAGLAASTRLESTAHPSPRAASDRACVPELMDQKRDDTMRGGGASGSRAVMTI